ncbi:hypothetical protein BDF19DRAFT_81412 [Syncephalis fuscata]|nr:hypothetical protein BDF19DRAFT_81412 [Syncephalis fuscata]
MTIATASALFRSNNSSRWRAALDDYSRAIRSMSEAKERPSSATAREQAGQAIASAVATTRAKKTSKGKRQKEETANLLQLDRWYQNELPQVLREREPAYMEYDELVKLLNWKLNRGKFRPRLITLIKSNKPADVQKATSKAFALFATLATDEQSGSDEDSKESFHMKEERVLAEALKDLCTLHGVGPATASAILAAYDSDIAHNEYDQPEDSSGQGRVPFMADEAIEAIPEVPSGRYTAPVYLRLFRALRDKAVELNGSAENEASVSFHWSARKVEIALWAAAVSNV